MPGILFFFLFLMWLICNWSSACVFNISGIITCLPLIKIPLITAMLSLNDQYVLISHCIMVFNFWPSYAVMYPFSLVSAHLVQLPAVPVMIDMYSWMFIVVCIVFIFMSMLCISSSLFSVWLCSIQPICNEKLWPWLVYYPNPSTGCILRRMHCILCDRVATSFLNTATRCLWSVIILTSLAKQ